MYAYSYILQPYVYSSGLHNHAPYAQPSQGQHMHHDEACLQLLAAEGLPLEEAEARVQQLTADVHAVLGAPRMLGQAVSSALGIQWPFLENIYLV